MPVAPVIPPVVQPVVATQNTGASQVTAAAQALIPVAHGLIEQANSAPGTSMGVGVADDTLDASKKGKKAEKIKCYRCGGVWSCAIRLYRDFM